MEVELGKRSYLDRGHECNSFCGGGISDEVQRMLETVQLRTTEKRKHMQKS